MQRLLGLLELEHERLTALHYRLSALVALLAADERRFLGRAADDVDVAADALHLVERERIAATDTAARGLGLQPPVTLSVLRSAVAGPEGPLLDAVGARLRGAVAAVLELQAEATALASAGSSDVTATLERLATGRQEAHYGIDGYRQPYLAPQRFDERA